MYDPHNTSVQPSVLSDSLSMKQIQVEVNGISQYTDDNGEVSFQASTINSFQVNLSSSEFYITDYTDSTKVYFSNSMEEYVPNSNIFTSCLGDSCKIGTTTKLCYGSNTFFHANDQNSALKNRWANYEVENLKIVTNYIPTHQANAGQISFNPPVVRIKTGLYSSIIRHELSHYFTYQVLGNHHFNTTLSQGRAMTEAFANYLSCSTVGAPYMIYPNPNGTTYDIINLSIPFVSPFMINEEGYSNYISGAYLASAWWDLRGNPLFPNDNQGVNGVDKLLVAGLEIVRRDIEDNASYRFKPRYFYNILMSRTATDTINWVLNPKQEAINKAYAERGFHFTPQVISAGVSNPQQGRDKNMFRIGDPIHVKITNCPQNTPLTVYIVQDQVYTDGMNVSALNNVVCQISGLGVQSDNFGEWYSNTPVMTASAVGDYDILIDIGNNGILHFGYLGANVRDGYDGLNGPGFTVYDDEIDVVLALDLSQSMVGECANLQRLTRSLIGAMLPGDRINTFGFNEGTPPNWNGGWLYNLNR